MKRCTRIAATVALALFAFASLETGASATGPYDWHHWGFNTTPRYGYRKITHTLPPWTYPWHTAPMYDYPSPAPYPVYLYPSYDMPWGTVHY